MSDLDSDDAYADEFIAPIADEEMWEEFEELFQDNPRETIKATRNGDLKAMQTLSCCPWVVPVHLTAGACEALCFHLRQGVPSVGAYDGVSQREQLAIVAVAGLLGLLRQFPGSMLENTVQNSWRAIAGWLLLFEQKFVRKNPSGSRLLSMNIASLLESVAPFSKVKEQICADFNMLKLIVHLWSDERAQGDSYGRASMCIALYSEFSKKTKDMIQKLVLQESYGVPDIAAENLLNRLRRRSRIRTSEDFEGLDGFASALVAFCSDSGDDASRMQLSIAMNDGIYEVLGVLRNVFEAFPPSDDVYFGRACNATAKCFTFILSILERPYGDIWMDALFTHGFLDSLLRVFPLLDQEPLRSSFHKVAVGVLTDFLPRICMLYSKTERVVKAMKDACTDEVQKRAASSPVAKEWNLFERFLFERATYKYFFDKNEDLGIKSVRCGNPGCENVDSKNDFKKCSGCKSVMYCSRECQIIAWKSKGHKKECKEKKGLEPKKQKDRDFVLYCSRRDVLRHLPGLQKLAERKLPDVAFHFVGVGIDYTTLPPTFEVFRLETLLDELTFVGKDSVEAARDVYSTLKKAREGKQDALLVRITQTEGKGKTITTHTEISLDNVGAFLISEEEMTLPGTTRLERPVGQDGNLNPVEVVECDKIDDFLRKLEADIARPDDVGVTPALWAKLEQIIADANRSARTQ
ncbi:hypothetical protein DFH11DRAFT_1568335 [Phellopilus nigrolimitatus]|nr:hypothetical protein DFH11DRAFT_1568335 [Phellopilus nigrolimitatus]